MAKLPFFKFFPLDWLRDTRQLSSKARAAWIDILAIAWNEPKRGVYTRDIESMMRELGLIEQEVDNVLAELSSVATVTHRNDFLTREVTIESRRMRREERARELNAIRQQRFRNNGKITALSRESVPETLEVRSKTLKTYPPLTPPPLGVGDFDNLWQRYPKRLGKKMAEKHFRASVKTKADWERINKALDTYLAYIRVEGIADQFVKHGSTWFNNWQDWVDYKGTNGKPPSLPPPPKDPIIPEEELVSYEQVKSFRERISTIAATKTVEVTR